MTDPKANARCFYFATPGLGENVQQTPIMRVLDQLGYRIQLVIRKRIAPAFELLPYLESVLPYGEEELLHKHGNTDISLDTLCPIRPTDVVLSCNRIGNNIRKKTRHIFDPSSPLYPVLPSDNNKSYQEGWASRHGIKLENLDMDVEFCEDYDGSLTHPAIGVCPGSGEKIRRLPISTIDSLVTALSHISQVLILGHDLDGQVRRIKLGINMTGPMTPKSLRTSLSYLKNLQLFISTDSGLSFCAIALGIPTIIIQTRTGSEVIAEIHRNTVRMYRKKNPQCSQNCIPYLRLSGSPYKVPSDYPQSLECNQSDSIPCLTDLSIGEIVTMAKEFICKKPIVLTDFTSCSEEQLKIKKNLENSLNITIPKEWKIIPTSWGKGVDNRRKKFHDFMHSIQELSLPIRNVMKSYWFHSALSYREMATFLDIIPEQLDVIVEIGLGSGGTHFRFSQISNKVLSIEKNLSQCIATAALMKLMGYPENKSVFICSDTRSDEAKQELEKELGSKKIDLLFIDGSHQFKNVMADYYEYRHYVRDGGWIAFDDFCNEAGVHLALREIWVRDRVDFEIIHQ